MKKKLDGIMRKLPENDQKDLMEIMKGQIHDDSYRKLKSFVDQYDTRDPSDTLLASVMVDLLTRITFGMRESLLLARSKGKNQIGGFEVAKVITTALMDMKEGIEKEAPMQ
jgi:hypothetical protein